MLATNTWIAENSFSEKSAPIYALGGGKGHFNVRI